MQRLAFSEAKDALKWATPSSDLCEPILSAIPMTGAALSVLVGPATQTTICSSDATASRLDELQFDLGEGPCWSAMSSRNPVLRSDFRSNSREWPAFTEAVRRDPHTEEVASIFAFPLSIGTIDLGALDFYSTATSEMEPAQVDEASELARLAAWQVLRRILDDHEAPYDSGSLGYSRREVHQATGMLIVQLGIESRDAELLLRAHAYSSGRSVREIANDIVERRLDFSNQGTPAGAE